MNANTERIIRSLLASEKAWDPERVGMMTIAGMLKRLKADKGLNEQITQADQLEKRKSKLNHVNYSRSNIREAGTIPQSGTQSKCYRDA